ncbi:hypothetical protein NQ314_013044, partial [Rhamnusium bicolor]
SQSNHDYKRIEETNNAKQVNSDNDKENDLKIPELNLKYKMVNETSKQDIPLGVVATTTKVLFCRGVFVFAGITLLFIMYLTFKTYRKRNKKNVLIKKYGVKTRRTDVEMEPLPLDDDEEDETVFDLGKMNNR